MDTNRALRNFEAACERARSVPTLKQAWFALGGSLGLGHVELCWGLETHLSNLAPSVVHNYPAAWTALSVSSNGLSNPVHRYASTTDHPFAWDDGLFQSQCGRRDGQFFQVLAELGLTGWTAPLRAHDGEKACVSLTLLSGADRQVLAAGVWSAMYFYAAMRRLGVKQIAARNGMLTRRESECLELVALGLREKGVARRLGIQPRTAHNHIERAKKKLGATNRVQAVQIWRGRDP